MHRHAQFYNNSYQTTDTPHAFRNVHARFYNNIVHLFNRLLVEINRLLPPNPTNSSSKYETFFMNCHHQGLLRVAIAPLAVFRLVIEAVHASFADGDEMASYEENHV